MKKGSGTSYNPKVVLALEKTMEKFLALKAENQLNFVKNTKNTKARTHNDGVLEFAPALNRSCLF